MIPSDHFVRFYNEVFKFLDERGGLQAYYEEISRHQELHCLRLFMEKGLQGMEEYWGKIRVEENCICTSRVENGVRYSHMSRCPSLSKVLDNDAEPCGKYCLHCFGWVAPLMTKCGFYYIKYQRALDCPECYAVMSEHKEKIESIQGDLMRQGFKYIFSNLDDSDEVEANRAKRLRRLQPNP
ncbi:MAG: hypothetical protein IJJ33_08020 [Victivallales bacterium]|nr:hypothetical protein [Victivallales bacterium]